MSPSGEFVPEGLFHPPLGAFLRVLGLRTPKEKPYHRLTGMAAKFLTDTRTGRNTRHESDGMGFQSANKVNLEESKS